MIVLDFSYAQCHVLYDASRGVQHLRTLIVGYLVLNRNRVCLGTDEPVLQALITYEHLHGGDRYRVDCTGKVQQAVGIAVITFGELLCLFIVLLDLHLVRIYLVKLAADRCAYRSV